MNEAVQDAEAQEPQTAVQEPVEPASDQQQHAEPEAGTAQETDADRHQLEPGGERFKQVWARAKAAEERAKQAEERAHQIEVEKARLEGERKAEAEAKQRQATEREYSHDELEKFIEDGRITRAQANAYKEERLTKRLEAKFQAELDAKLRVTQKVSTINEDLERYKKAMPALMQAGTTERAKYENEYTYLVNNLGYPDNLATQLAAARAAFGPADALERQAATKAATTQQRTPFMDTATTSTKPAVKTKDPIQSMEPRQKEHYLKMIKNGRYGSFSPHVGVTEEHWEEVRKELSWSRKKR